MIFNLKKHGFTLVEVLVIISITGLILPTLFGIIFTLLRLQYQVEQLTRLKESGDFVTNQIIYTIREHASKVDSDDECGSVFLTIVTSPSAYVLFKDGKDNCFGYYVENNKLLSYGSGVPLQGTTLIDNTDTDFPILVESAQMQAINKELARFKLVLKTQPTVSYLPEQKLSYQFYTYIRKYIR